MTQCPFYTIGVDVGFGCTGLALLGITDSGVILVDYSYFKEKNQSKKDHSSTRAKNVALNVVKRMEGLFSIAGEGCEVAVALEGAFFNRMTKNANTAMSQIRLIQAIEDVLEFVPNALNTCAIFEYNPATIKSCLIGKNGNKYEIKTAIQHKIIIQKTIQTRMEKVPKGPLESIYDAAAIAYTHINFIIKEE